MVAPKMEQVPLSALSLCISPCITAKTKGLTDYVIRYHLYSLVRKVDVLCKALDELRLSADNHKLSGHTQIYLKFVNLAPVLTMIAANDIKRLSWCTTVDTVQVPQFTSQWRPTAVTTCEVVNYGILVTWAI
ncbi:uncharacterized protein A1O5_09363 [Cladophialophora psammophila CBS 110553]|uniref:Uncharacterized protein n=1 Tax=Cladophialophora psammophila CBS 110553 TaxID=1182543 RepID=W9WQW7_9EURO|nr:uncharacterized protein A1O5_09363 [Cladophialophora psammophila CBS 110553]EXJ67350.1 hypothetical protein A1O5_09363 [Cladophialophora psammophila CBS 110553]